MKKLTFILFICMIAMSCSDILEPTSEEEILRKKEIEEAYHKRQTEEEKKKTITIAVFYSGSHVDTLYFETTKSHVEVIGNNGSSHVCCWNGYHWHKLQGSIFQTTAPVKVLSIE